MKFCRFIKNLSFMIELDITNVYRNGKKNMVLAGKAGVKKIREDLIRNRLHIHFFQIKYHKSEMFKDVQSESAVFLSV